MWYWAALPHTEWEIYLYHSETVARVHFRSDYLGKIGSHYFLLDLSRGAGLLFNHKSGEGGGDCWVFW